MKRGCRKPGVEQSRQYINSIAMKKILFFLLFLGIANSFFYCSKKAGDSPKSGLIQKTPADNNIGRLKADDGGLGSVTCNCSPGFSKCEADCLFSSCCICWDPKKETGACGCYFGIAKCQTAPIGASSVNADPHSIKIYHHRLQVYFEFLKQIPSDLSPLQESFKMLLKYSVPDTRSKNEEVVMANERNYDDFYRTYTDYINSLTENDKKLIVEYINRAKERE